MVSDEFWKAVCVCSVKPMFSCALSLCVTTAITDVADVCLTNRFMLYGMRFNFSIS